MISRNIFLISILILSSCTLSDNSVIPDKTNTGSLIKTGGVLSGTISPTKTGMTTTGTTTLTYTGASDHQDPLVEDLSGSGDAYYPIFT